LIKAKWGDSINPPKDLEGKSIDFANNEDDANASCDIPDIEDTIDTDDYLIDNQPSYDKMINAEVMMQQDKKSVRYIVKGRTVGQN
jgi:hypothetical protein